MPKPFSKPPRASDPPGKRLTGRVVSLLIGQSHGFIRLKSSRQVFFHRSDLEEGTSFNRLQVGDIVAFELFDDSISGARALRVSKKTQGSRHG